MGRVDIFVEDVSELKEVSSRDSGLVDTPMSRQVWNCLNKVKKGLKDMLLVFYGGNPF